MTSAETAEKKELRIDQLVKDTLDTHPDLKRVLDNQSTRWPKDESLTWVEGFKKFLRKDVNLEGSSGVELRVLKRLLEEFEELYNNRFKIPKNEKTEAELQKERELRKAQFEFVRAIHGQVSGEKDDADSFLNSISNPKLRKQAKEILGDISLTLKNVWRQIRELLFGVVDLERPEGSSTETAKSASSPQTPAPITASNDAPPTNVDAYALQKLTHDPYQNVVNDNATGEPSTADVTTSSASSDNAEKKAA
jgi:hypothetical protein